MKEVELGEITFRINKLLPLKGEALLMKHIVPFIGVLLGSPAADDGNPAQPAPASSEADPKTPETPESTLGLSPSHQIELRVRFIRIIAAGLANLPYHHYQAIRTALFSAISYRRKEMDKFKPLVMDEEYAFQGCDPMHIIMLVGEAFLENFTESYGVLMSRYTVLATLAENLNAPGT